MLKMMTSDMTVVTAARDFLPWLLLMPVIGCAAFTWDGIYIGATASKAIRNSMLWAVVSFFAVWAVGLAFPDVPGEVSMHILMGAYFAHLLARTVYLSVRYRRDVSIN